MSANATRTLLTIARSLFRVDGAKINAAIEHKYLKNSNLNPYRTLT